MTTSPRLLINSNNGEYLESLKGRTYLEAVIMTLINQALAKDTRASDLLLSQKTPPRAS